MTLIHPIAGVALGRKRPIATGLQLRFGNYMLKSMPPCPVDDVDYSVKPADYLRQVLLNDQLGCCTASAAFHVGGTFLANADQPVLYTDDDVKRFYSATTGYVDGIKSTDTGGSAVDVLNYWQQYGLLGDGTHRIVGHITVDGSNTAEVMSAIYAFENLYFGLELSEQWLKMRPFDGQVWNADAVADPNDGHCVMSCKAGKTTGGVEVDSWGYKIIMPFDTVAKYTSPLVYGELYSVLSIDGLMKAQQKFPNGLDWSQLLADLMNH